MARLLACRLQVPEVEVELEVAMALCRCPSPKDITRGHVTTESDRIRCSMLCSLMKLTRAVEVERHGERARVTVTWIQTFSVLRHSSPETRACLSLCICQDSEVDIASLLQLVMVLLGAIEIQRFISVRHWAVLVFLIDTILQG